MRSQHVFRGAVFGEITVVTDIGSDHHGNVRWQCLCSCGATTVAVANKLVGGRKRSCGCKHKQLIGDAAATHGETRGRVVSAEYTIWSSMRARCTDENHVGWSRYGERGIKVCERWWLFENFLADMGRRPSRAHSIDRIDNDGNYAPENCRLVTPMKNANNRSNNRVLLFGDERVTVAEASRKFGVSESAIHRRLRSGDDVASYLRALP